MEENEMVNDIDEQVKTLLDITQKQKSAILELVNLHPEWNPVLRHDLLHHVLQQDVFPEKLTGESDFDFRSRLISLRRRLDVQNRLAGCVLMLLDEQQ